MSLSDQSKAIILGSVLGDGSLKIHRPYRNARFSFRHSVKQEKYFRWKAKALSEISSARCIWRQGTEHGDGWGGEKLRYQSLALESLTGLYRLTHKKRRFRIIKKWLNILAPLSLAIWWLDDGSLVVNSRKGVLCTDGFSCRQVKRLADYLQEVWQIRTSTGRVNRIGRVYYRLWIRSTTELKKLLRIVLPHIPVASMLPKVIMLYKDKDLQQRWISEVVQLSRFSRKTVERYYLIKKQKWTRFR